MRTLTRILAYYVRILIGTHHVSTVCHGNIEETVLMASRDAYIYTAVIISMITVLSNYFNTFSATTTGLLPTAMHIETELCGYLIYQLKVDDEARVMRVVRDSIFRSLPPQWY